MKLKKLSALLAVSTLLATSSAMAWESESGAWSTSANVAFGTDYVWRGVSQTDNEPAISGGFDVGHSSGLYAGLWASNVDFGDESSASAEVDYYAGFASDIGDTGLSYDIGGLYYAYPDEDGLDFFEFYGSLSYSIVTASVSYSQDLFGTEAQDDLYYNLSASYDVGPINLAAAVGYYDWDDKSSEDYTDYKIGASTELAGFGFDLSYTDTDLKNSEDAVIFTISKSM